MSIGDANVTCSIQVTQPGCTVSCNQFGSSSTSAGNFAWSLGVEVGTIEVDWTYPNGKTPPLVIESGQTKQLTAGFSWFDESDNVPTVNLNGTVTAIVNGQTMTADFQIGAYSAAAGIFERPDGVNFVVSQGGNMSEGYTVTIPDVKTTFDGPTFVFSGLSPSGDLDDKGNEIWNMTVSIAEEVALKLLLSAAAAL